MPLYEYICQKCDNQFEKRVSFSEADEEQECPVCGSKHSRKKISLFASKVSGSTFTSSGTASGCGGSGGFT
ncbi:MAG: zinc ribbon domain-containing protein [Leptolinea sp.]|nr:zinc ribbon domain-containing protein [Leptolinea sp.]